ncbi:MAG: DUF3253 domain-containing protein [Kordiimonadaceae bacterium]|jgi:hypothetical protein|nr:DUF3253 domain-containing protein [Kordiimonadaceae bacterium]MBT6328315.1 DUF3253 domain-containing protein [Kordiimonadaceae bacterium]MBT7583154.1 DUF3253 domain-containing protein [Kordiimonadaceae bacterium]
MTDVNDQNEEDEIKEDPIRLYIMDAVAAGGAVSPNDIAIKIAKDRAKDSDPDDVWRKYLLSVKQQAKSLARAGRISILRRGKPIDPNKMKGLIKLSLPVEDE